VAFVAQGTTIQWGSSTLGEVVSVGVDGLSSETVDVTPRSNASRAKSYSVADTDYGTVSVTCRGTAAMSSTNVGLTATLSIGGPGVSFSFTKAIMESLSWQASVGELQTYSVTFKMGA
jgi:hypothetical protein